LDPILPIGPRERDLEPVVKVVRQDPDARREQREREEREEREQRRRAGRGPAGAGSEPVPPHGDDDPPPLIDVRV
jgi:hypothetical protein